MQCERLIQMIKSWYNHVRDETMAPARMVSFMEQHVGTCDICVQDPDVKEEIAKITEMVLPESKIPKAVRQQNQAADEEDEDEDDGDDSDSESDEDEDEDKDEDEDEDDLDIDDDFIPDSEES
jgi:hypothetical protein